MHPFILIGAVIVGLPWLVYLLWRFPGSVTLTAFTAVVLLDCLQFGTSGFEAGISLYPDDLACAALLAGVAVIAAKNRAFPRYICWPSLLLLGLIGLNFLRGAILYGAKPAGNDSRNLIYLVLPFLIFGALGQFFRFNFSRITIALCAAAAVFTCIALCRWAGILPIPEYEYVDDFRDVSRVLPAEYPMIIGQAVIALVGSQLARGLRLSGLLTTALFLAVLVGLQHRSVWSATAIGLMWLAIRSSRSAAKRWRHFAAAAMLFAGVGSLFLLVTGRTAQLTTMLKANVEETTQDDSTWAWRMRGFTEATDRAFNANMADILLGPPSGRDLSEVASYASIHIHDRYIHTLAYYGVSGLLLLSVSLWKLGQRLRCMSAPARYDGSSTKLAGPVFEAILISEFTYFVAYGGAIAHGAILGLLWAASVSQLVHRQTPRQMASASPSRSRDLQSIQVSPVP